MAPTQMATVLIGYRKELVAERLLRLLSENKITQITDLLEQINLVNKVMEAHSIEPTLLDQSMIRQYELRRKEFVDSLQELIQYFHIRIQYQPLAA